MRIIADIDKDYIGRRQSNDEIGFLRVEDLIETFTVKEHIELMKEIYPSFKERKELRIQTLFRESTYSQPAG